jgi:hypothetical protein
MNDPSIVPIGQTAIVERPSRETEIGDLIRVAMERGIDAASLERLVGVYERMESARAARQFNDAMARFQADCEPIVKNKKASIVSGSGAKWGYQYASLDEIARTIREPLQLHGLSYTWDSLVDGNKILCTCTVRHAGGHSSSATFSATIDEKMSVTPVQKSGAALTYAKRQSLVQALGLSIAEFDTDGNEPDTIDTISPSDVSALLTALDETKSDIPKFCAAFGIATVDALPTSKLPKAMSMIEAKRRQQ